MTDACDSPTDAHLLAQTAQGDGAAYAELVSRHQAAVYRYARTLAGDGAEDVLQQAFLDGMRGAHTYSGGASVRTWLLVLARNAAFRGRRLRAGEPKITLPLHELGVIAGWGEDPEQETARHLDAERLRRALTEVPAVNREVIVLRDLEGLSAAEVSEVLGVQISAVKSRLHRGRLQLAAAVRQEFGHGR